MHKQVKVYDEVELKFNQIEWQTISAAMKHLLTGMLEKNPDNRLTIEDVL